MCYFFLYLFSYAGSVEPSAKINFVVIESILIVSSFKCISIKNPCSHWLVDPKDPVIKLPLLLPVLHADPLPSTEGGGST